MTSSSTVLPEQRLAVSVLANGGEEELGAVTASILVAAARGRLPSPSAPPDAPAPAADQHSYAGAFSEPNLGDVTIRWQDAQLC